MSRWLDRVDGLLYDGESVQTTVDFGSDHGHGVVVTSHRVLAFTPGSDGANYRAVDRPNVDGVELTSSGQVFWLRQGVKAGVVGVVLLLAGTFVSLDGLVGDVAVPSGTGQLGIGGLLGMLQTLLDLLALLDEILLVTGALTFLAGVALTGVYVLTREERLVIGVAGGADVELLAPEDEELAARIERAVRPPASPDESPTGSTPAGDPLA